MDVNAAKITHIHSDYQPDNFKQLAQFNLFTGEAEPIPLEDIYNCRVDRGFIYLIPKEDAVVFNLTDELKIKTKNMLYDIREMISLQQVPSPEKSRNKCFDCGYRNFCGDIF